jgi:hypothetical protein
MAARLISSVLVGVLGALAVAVLVLVSALAFGFLRIWWDFGGGSGDIGAFSVDVPGLLGIAIVAGFVLGFSWRFRRSSPLRR